MIRRPRCFTTTSGQDTDDTDEEGTQPDGSSNDNQKVLLYAVYGFNDLADIQQRDFIEEQAMFDGKRNADGSPRPDADTLPSFSFAVEADIYSLDDIFAKAKDQFGTSQNLQYYHIENDEWCNLRDHEDLDTFQTYLFAWVFRPITSEHPLPKVVPIRIPQYFQEMDETEEDDTFDTPNEHNLEGMIEYLLFQLMQSEWQRVDVPEDEVTGATVWRLRRTRLPDERSAAEKPSVPDAAKVASEEPSVSATPEGTEDPASTAATSSTAPPHKEEEGFVYLDTRDWVLQHAASNAKLRRLLVYYPHALEHITECLHYSFLWDNFPRLNDGTPHPEGVSAIEDELPPSVERVVPYNESRNSSTSSNEETLDSQSTSSTTA